MALFPHSDIEYISAEGKYVKVPLTFVAVYLFYKEKYLNYYAYSGSNGYRWFAQCLGRRFLVSSW